MPSFERHCQDCINALGEPFEEVHLWLDEYFDQMGPKHRVVRHHEEGIREVEEMWGKSAAKAAEIHIKADCNGRVPTMQEVALWGLFTWGRH